MIQKTLFILLLSASTVCSAQNKSKNAAKPVAAPKTEMKSLADSASYAFGFGVASDLKQRGITALNYTVLTKAMEDAFKEVQPSFTLEQGQKVIHSFLSTAKKTKYASSIAEGNQFLAENKAKPGIVTLPSGVQYLVIQNGTGAKPKATDEVTVHYKGTLINGKQFDSSYDRNEPLTIVLNRVIPGWTEGVQQMPVGSKYKFFIPSELAYGENGAGEEIPPYSVLVFEIELLKANAPAPAPAPAPQAETNKQ